MTRAKPGPADLERRLFDFSLGELRLLDAVLQKAGQKKLAGLLRDVLLDWRAYPSRTVYSTAQLRGYAASLGKIAAGLRKAGKAASVEPVLQVKREIESWVGKS